jgi:ABC-type bacteriocin/lantibiotic exporter with double-glycine peptidase domain
MINIAKILSLLTKKEKIRSFKLFFFIVINNLAELLSLGALITIVYSILSGTKNSIQIFEMKFSIQEFDDKDFLVILLILSIIFIIKNLISYQFFIYQFNFLKKIKKRISHDLYKKYLSNKYLFFINKNSSELLRNIRIATDYNSILYGLFTFFAEIIMIIILVTALLFIDPLMTVISLIFFAILSIFIHYILKKKFLQLGLIKQELEIAINKSSLQTFQSIKEIKLYGSSNFFTKLFDQTIGDYGRIEKEMNIFQQVPKLIFEASSILILSLLLSFMSYSDYSKERYLLIITSLSVISLRLIPSLTRIAANLQRLKFFQPSVDILALQFKDDFTQKIEKTNFYLGEFKSLEIKNLNFKYGEKNNNVYIKDLNLKINRGEIFGLFGQSGSGKSTLLHLITGLVKPSRGEILVNEKKLKNSTCAWLNKISYVPQSVYLFEDSIIKNIFFDDINFDKSKFNKSLEISTLNKLIDTFPNKENTQVGENSIKISGGQKQMIGIARAIYRNPEILILDEATSSIDAVNSEEILRNIKKFKEEKNITIIIISHDVKVMNFCDKVFFIKENIVK